MSPSCGYSSVSALRSAWSSACTGPTPSPTATTRASPSSSRTIASLRSVLAWGDDPPEPPAVLAWGDDPPEPPAVLAWGDDPPEPPAVLAEEDHPGRAVVSPSFSITTRYPSRLNQAGL